MRPPMVSQRSRAAAVRQWVVVPAVVEQPTLREAVAVGAGADGGGEDGAEAGAEARGLGPRE